jgi:hypothetical protein
MKVSGQVIRIINEKLWKRKKENHRNAESGRVTYAGCIYGYTE